MSSAITDNDIPPEMLAKLQNDTFIFSGLRTHAQLLEASSFLMEDGKVRGFDAFAKDFNKVNINYNQNYLEAEHQFAVSSSQSAANWAALDPNGRYNLQYRTANDDRVRADHAALQNITLPVDDNFWLTYYPPNGWRCRCLAVEVLKTKYELSDSVKANEAGDRATTKLGPDGKNRSAIFRFNPGIEQKVFPPKHPYNKVKDAETVKEILKEKPVEYKNLVLEQLKIGYKYQEINKANEKMVMGKNGYVATSNSFEINYNLREKEELSPANKKVVASLDNLIESNPLKDNIRLHRFVSHDFIKSTFDIFSVLNSPEENLEALKKSEIKQFSTEGFSSASAIEKKNVFQNRGIKLEILAKKGTKAFVTTNYVESEVIFGRNQIMKIVDYKLTNGRIDIVVETD